MARVFQYDETQLRPGQREAAMLLVEYEFTPHGERKTQEEIAKEVGISRRTLYSWNHHDPNFIAYKNSLASQMLDSELAFVYKKLLEGIKNGSMKGIETYLKRIGDLDRRDEITVHQGDGDALSFEERREELLARLGGEEEEEE